MSIEDAISGMIAMAALGFLAGFWIAIKLEGKRYAGALTKSDLAPLRKAAEELEAMVKRRVSNSWHNVAIGEKALSALLQTPEERGVEVYYVDGPNGIKVQQFRPKRQEGA